MDSEYVGRVPARLKPFIRDGVIRRTRLERVLGTLQTPPQEIRPEVERLLGKAGVLIDEDAPDQVVEPPPPAADEQADQDPDEGDFDGDPLGDAEFGADIDAAGPHYVPPARDDDAIQAARRRIALDRRIRNHSHVLLKPEEEVGLAMLVRGWLGRALEQGDFERLTGEAREAAECLFLHNQKLIYSLAKRYAPPSMTFDDLAQHGAIGLIRAVELFDPTRGNKFSTYATWWIRQAITRGIANDARLIRLPVHMHERVLKVWMTRSRLTVDGEPPTIHQLALACDLTDEEVKECLILGPQNITSLDTPVGDEGNTTLGDLLDFADPDDAHSGLEYEMLQAQLAEVLKTISEREAGVIKLRFGLTDGVPRTLDEIGQVYGVTRERIRQIEGKAMGKLRHPSRSQVLRPYLNVVEGDPKPPAKSKPVAENAME